MNPCIVEGCDNSQHPKAAKGMCRKHYYKLQRYGDPLFKYVRPLIDNPGYSAVHKNLVKYRGRADKYQCAKCNNAANQWACVDNLTELETVKGYQVKYSKNLDDYRPMCYSCHRKADKIRGKAD